MISGGVFYRYTGRIGLTLIDLNPVLERGVCFIVPTDGQFVNPALNLHNI